MWIAVVDFKKAFGTIEHNGPWTALRRQGVPPEDHPLQRLYYDQTACVRADTASQAFKFRRGTKHGDSLSALLLNALLQRVLDRSPRTGNDDDDEYK